MSAGHTVHSTHLSMETTMTECYPGYRDDVPRYSYCVAKRQTGDQLIVHTDHVTHVQIYKVMFAL